MNNIFNDKIFLFLFLFPFPFHLFFLGVFDYTCTTCVLLDILKQQATAFNTTPLYQPGAKTSDERPVPVCHYMQVHFCFFTCAISNIEQRMQLCM